MNVAGRIAFTIMSILAGVLGGLHGQIEMNAGNTEFSILLGLFYGFIISAMFGFGEFLSIGPHAPASPCSPSQPEAPQGQTSNAPESDDSCDGTIR